MALCPDRSLASASAVNLSAVSSRLFRSFGHQEERARVVACRAAARSSLLLNGLDMPLERRSRNLVSLCGGKFGFLLGCHQKNKAFHRLVRGDDDRDRARTNSAPKRTICDV